MKELKSGDFGSGECLRQKKIRRSLETTPNE